MDCGASPTAATVSGRRSGLEGRGARRTESRRVKFRTLLVLLIVLTSATLVAADPAPWVAGWTARVLSQPPVLLRFSPDGRRLAVGARTRWMVRVDGRFKVGDNALAIVDATSGGSVIRLRPHGEELIDVAFTGGDTLAVVFNDKRGAQSRTTYDAQTWKPRHSDVLFSPSPTSPHGEQPERAGEYGVFSGDGRYFAAHYGRVTGEIVPPLRFVGRTVVFETSDWREKATFDRQPGADSPLMGFTTDGGLLVDSPVEYGDRDEAVRYNVIETVSRLLTPLYRFDAPPRLQVTVSLWGPQWASAVSPNGRWIVGATANNSLGSLLAWDIDGGRATEPRVQALDRSPRLSRQRRYSALDWSPDGAWLVAGMSDGTVRLWDARTFTLMQEVPGSGAEITALRLSPDSQALAVATKDGRVRVFRRP